MGGIQKLLFELIKTTQFSNFNHSVICLIQTSGELQQAYKELGIHIYFCPLPWQQTVFMNSYKIRRFLKDYFGFPFTFQFYSLLAQIRPDLVHTHFPICLLEQAQVMNFKKIPWAITAHGVSDLRPKILSDWRKAFRIAFKNHSKIITVSKYIQKFLAEKVKINNQISVIYNGVEIKNVVNLNKWRKKMNIPREALTFGLIGRLSPEKGQDVFIKALAVLREQKNDVYGLILGEGGYRSYLQKLIVSLRLEDRCYLLGYDLDVPSFFKEIDVLVTPSRQEGFSLAFLEARMLRVPVIASRVGGLCELIKELNGVGVQPDNPKDLAVAMSQMSNLDHLNKFREPGEALRLFSLEQCADKYLEVYKSLLRVS